MVKALLKPAQVVIKSLSEAEIWSIVDCRMVYGDRFWFQGRFVEIISVLLSSLQIYEPMQRGHVFLSF